MQIKVKNSMESMVPVGYREWEICVFCQSISHTGEAIVMFVNYGKRHKNKSDLCFYIAMLYFRIRNISLTPCHI